MALDVPVDGRLFWLSSDPLPSGWVEDTALDGYYLQGADENYTGPTTGGSPWHVHVIADHVHLANGSHVHNFYSASGGEVGVFAYHQKQQPIAMVAAAHTHGNKDSKAATVTYPSSGSQSTLTASDPHPQYIKAVVIRPDTTPQDVPNGTCCFTDETNPPASWSIADGLQTNPGGGGTPDMDERFLWGATTGQGGSTGGSTSHTHNPNAGHTHPSDDHTHSAQICSPGSPTKSGRTPIASSVSIPTLSHHNVSLSSANAGSSGSSGPMSESTPENSNPLYRKLLGIQNTTGSSETPTDIVIAYVGDVSSGVPNGWTLMDGSGESNYDCRDRQIMGTTDTGEVGNAGGAATHYHPTTAHTHSHFATHNHNTSVTFTDSPTSVDSDVTYVLDDSPHTHAWTVDDNFLGGWSLQGAAPDTDSVDVRYNYRTCVWLKKVAATATDDPSIGTHYGVDGVEAG